MSNFDDYEDDDKDVNPSKNTPQNVTEIKCPNCEWGMFAVKRNKKGNEFLACNSFPDCRNTANFKRDPSGKIVIINHKPSSAPAAYHKSPCPDCGSKLALRDGKFGKFYSCINYPACKKTLPYTTGVKCPTCRVGEFVEKISSKTGKKFYGCNNFPGCSMTMWHYPYAIACRKCQHPVQGGEISGDHVQLTCPKCKYFSTEPV